MENYEVLNLKVLNNKGQKMTVDEIRRLIKFDNLNQVLFDKK